MTTPLALSVDAMLPSPTMRVQFAWPHFKQVPETAGCYVLTTFSGFVLYVGQATSSIRSRFCDHLQTDEKRKPGPLGVAFWFYFLPYEKQKVSAIERGWINQALLASGKRPPLNKADAPT